MMDEREIRKRARIKEIEEELRVIKEENTRNFRSNYLKENFGVNGFYSNLIRK